MKNNFINFYYLFHKFSLLFFSKIIVISTILYFINYTQYHQTLYLSLYVAIGIFVFFFFIKNNISSFIIILIFLTSAVIATNIYDISPDGRSAHLVNNFFHLIQYNPFYDPCAEFVKKNSLFLDYFWIGTYNAQFASHSIVFLENIFVIFMKNIEASKALKIIIFLMSFYPVYLFLNQYEFSKKIKTLFFFIILLNPIVLTQFVDSYKDFYGYYLILNSLIFFYLVLKNNSFNKEYYYFLILNLFILASAKFNFFCFSIFFLTLFTIFIFIKFKIKNIILYFPIILIFLVIFSGFTPAVKTFGLNNKYLISETNYIQNKPTCWESRTPISDTRPEAMKFNKESSNIHKLLIGLMTKGSADDYKNYPNVDWDFYKIEKSDFYFYFLNAVPYYGGGGPFFGSVFIFLFFYTIYFLIKKRETNFKIIIKKHKYHLLITAILFFSVIIFPLPNVFRLVPQIWLIPILIFIFYLKLDDKNVVINFLIFIISLNVLLVFYLNLCGAYYGQNMYKKNNIIFFKNLKANENLDGWFSNWGYQLYQYSKMHKNFKIQNVKRIDMKNCKVVLNSYNTQGSFCLDKVHEKKKIIREVNENVNLYKKRASYLTFYYPKDVIVDIK